MDRQKVLLLHIMTAKEKDKQPPCCWTVEELKEQIKLSMKDIEEGKTISSEEAESFFKNYQYEK